MKKQIFIAAALVCALQPVLAVADFKKFTQTGLKYAPIVLAGAAGLATLDYAFRNTDNDDNASINSGKIALGLAGAAVATFAFNKRAGLKYILTTKQGAKRGLAGLGAVGFGLYGLGTQALLTALAGTNGGSRDFSWQNKEGILFGNGLASPALAASLYTTYQLGKYALGK